MIKKPAELMGSFYLGAQYDLDKKQHTEELVHYDARDLTTHAICVGMTGSGKTGLCIGLLEEAAMDKVPAIIIDPKGDMTNLLLQFEDLDPSDFKTWINADDASRKGMTQDEYAEKIAGTWKNGLEQWGQGPERIKALKDSVDYTIFTPGSNSGIPINILGSFAAPGVDFDSEAEMLRERIQGMVAALLGMIQSKEDPVRSREGILLSTLFEHYWRLNEDIDLAKLIQGIQNPPVRQLGVFDVDTFFPEKDRFDLAMEFNTLVASPQFQYWLTGEPLDIEKIYFTAEGKPRHSIFYIAHLSDSERMFFVTLLLNSLITWMRKQSGTTSLRSLLYFDEVFGYFPPTANPPSKKPMLTLLKQARAFGVGCVLVTQNPVDIDYKGISNAGTWFIGKLQTERDKARVLDGLENAISEAGGKSGIDFDRIISALDSRVFLLHNVHEDEPVIYNTRWAMSYLRGPMTRPQVKELMAEKKRNAAGVVAPTLREKEAAAATPSVTSASTSAPALDPDIEQRFLTVWKSGREAQSELGSQDLSVVYEPAIIATGAVRFYDGRRGIDEVRPFSLIAGQPDGFGRVPWQNARTVASLDRMMVDQADAPEGVTLQYNSIPDAMNDKKSWKSIESDLEDHMYAEKRLLLKEHSKLKITQEPGESDASFFSRLQTAAKELRDAELDKIEDRFTTKMEKIEDKIRKEERDLAEAEAEKSSRKTAEWVNAAETIFSVFVKGRSRSFGSAATKRRMARKAAEKVAASEEDLRELEEDYRNLEEELKEALDEVRAKWEASLENLDTREVAPRKTDIKVDFLAFGWHPFWADASGNKVSALND